MIAQKQPCLDADTIRELLDGRLPSERFELALEHLDSCESCRSQADSNSQISLSASWLEPESEVSAEPNFIQESECLAALHKLVADPPSEPLGGQKSKPLQDDSLPMQLGVYRLMEPIGSGGMGTVLLAEHQRLKKKVAVKILPVEKSGREGWLDRFNREMMSIAALEHPNVVRAMDAGEDQGQHYLVMEYLGGFDLGRITRRVGEMSVGSACEIVRQAALGLEAIHAAKMVHRDVKPSNLFLTRSGTVKLLDLGLVLDGESPVAGDDRLTTVGHLMGTLPYMSREQILDSSQVDYRADLYSLGATLFRLLTGKTPLGSSSDLPGTLQRITTQDCPSLGVLRSDLPKPLVELVDALLSHDPATRPDSAAVLAERLVPHCHGQDLEGLIRIAEQAPERDATLRTFEAAGAAMASDHGRGGMSTGWGRLVGYAAIPFALLAGVLVTLATNRGTLVVESQTADVTVAIKQNSEVVKSLRVAKSEPESVTLWSGEYEIEVVGEGLDRVALEEGSVAIFRGGERVVRVLEKTDAIKSPNPAAMTSANDFPTLSASSKSKTYQGKSFEHWLDVLGREQDAEMLFDAMDAVALLAETEEEQRIAAEELLRPASTLGGITWGLVDGGKRSPRTQAERSQSYMQKLMDASSSLRIENTLAVIASELRAGNKRMKQACVLVAWNLTKNRSVEFQELAQSKGSTFKSEVQTLSAALTSTMSEVDPKEKSAESREFLSIARYTTLELYLAINGSLSKLAKDEHMVAWANEEYGKALDALNKWLEKRDDAVRQYGSSNSGPGHLDLPRALLVHRALKTVQDPRPIALGLMQKSYGRMGAAEAQSRSELLNELLVQYGSTPIASSAEIMVKMIAEMSPGVGGVAFDHSIEQTALGLIKSHSDPIVPLTSLAQLKAKQPGRFGTQQHSPDAVRGAFDYDDVVKQLIHRVITETKLDDPRREAKLAYAARAMYWNRCATPESVALLLAELREADFTPIRSNITQKWPQDYDQTIRNEHFKEPKWNQATTRYYIRQLFLDSPELCIPAALAELETGNATSAVHICSFLGEIPELWPGEARSILLQMRLVETGKPEMPSAWKDYFYSNKGQQQLRDLVQALSKVANEHSESGELMLVRNPAFENLTIYQINAAVPFLDDAVQVPFSESFARTLEMASEEDVDLREVSSYVLFARAISMAESLEISLSEPEENWLRDLVKWYTRSSTERVPTRFDFPGDLLLAASKLEFENELFERVLLRIVRSGKQVRDLEAVIGRREGVLEFLVDRIVEADVGTWEGLIEFYTDSTKPTGIHPWQVVVRLAMSRPELAKKLEPKFKELAKVMFPAGDSSITIERALRAKL